MYIYIRAKKNLKREKNTTKAKSRADSTGDIYDGCPYDRRKTITSLVIHRFIHL